MKKTQDYLDEVIRQHGNLKNDSQLAHFLKITRQAVSQYRNGTSMHILTAVRIADILALDPMETISATMHEQCDRDEHKEFWKLHYLAALRPKKNG